ncbi:MAG: ABC transporter ATP-binding protein [Deltaproteobacteria bacterium]|nr:ABC transporter ATP-binding protein [Deltaproteobacteria bacterium]
MELTGASKIYQNNGLAVRALSGINLKIEGGEFMVLAGPSGSGKSTLLHLIGALDQPSEGSITIAGQDLARLSRTELALFRLHKVGFVFQSFNLIPVLSARENIEYPLLLQGIDRKERGSRIEDLLARVGLSDQAGKRPGEMSGGQQQRVAIARALATRPEIVLADEPTANLDSQTGIQLIQLFRELNEFFKTTFLFASHDPNVIERARRIIRLKDGRVLGEGA